MKEYLENYLICFSPRCLHVVFQYYISHLIPTSAHQHLEM